MFGFDSKYILLFPSFFCFGFKSQTQNKHFFCFFLHTYFQPISQKNKKLNVFFFFFFAFAVMVWHGFKSQTPKNTCFFCEILMDHIYSKKEQRVFWCFHFRTKKTKKPRENKQNTSFKSKPNILLFFFVLLDFFVSFGFSIDSHDCHLCPYACLPYRSWEVKFWSNFVTQALAHYVRLSLA